MIELVDPNQIVFRENFTGQFLHDCSGFFGGNQQFVMGVHAYKTVLSMIQIVIALAQIKIKYTDGIYFLHLLIGIPQGNMLCNSFSRTI